MMSKVMSDSSCVANWQSDAWKSIMDSTRVRKIDVAGAGVIRSNFRRCRRGFCIAHLREQQVAQVLAEHVHE